MKRKTTVLFFSALLCFVLLSGCSSDTEEISQDLIGVWNLTSASIGGEVQDTKDTLLTYTFDVDNIVLQNSNGTITDGTYEIDGNQIKMTFPGGEFEATLSNNNLTMQQEVSGSTLTYTFSKIEKKEVLS